MEESQSRRRFEWFMALRYLRGAEGRAAERRFIRFMTYLAIGGVAVGVAALLLAFSIVRGFSGEIRNKIVAFGNHIQVETYYDAPIAQADTLLPILAAYPGVERVAPVVLELALLRANPTRIEGVQVWGTEGGPTFLSRQIVAGKLDFAPDSTGLPGMVIGEKLAEDLGLTLGDRVTVYSQRGMNLRQNTLPGTFTQRPKIKQFHLVGFYDTGLADLFDATFVFIDLNIARDFLDYGANEVTRFDVTLADVQQADAVAEQMDDDIGFPILISSVFSIYAWVFAWVELQEAIIPIVISVIILVAAFNIIGILLIVILEKTKEIGIMGSLGVSKQKIRRMFRWLGMLIGIVGTGLGEALAFGLGTIQQQFGLIPVPTDTYYIDTAPIDFSAFDFLLVGIVAIALCTLAAYIPARVAARIDPVRAIRLKA